MQIFNFIGSVVVLLIWATVIATVIFGRDEKKFRIILKVLCSCFIISVVLVIITVFMPKYTVWDYDDIKQYRLAPLASWYKHASISPDALALINGGFCSFEAYDREDFFGSPATTQYSIRSDQVSIKSDDSFGRLVVTQSYIVKRRQFLFLYIENNDKVGQPTYMLVVPESAIMNTRR